MKTKLLSVLNEIQPDFKMNIRKRKGKRQMNISPLDVAQCDDDEKLTTVRGDLLLELVSNETSEAFPSRLSCMHFRKSILY